MLQSQRSPAPKTATGPRVCLLAGDNPENNPSPHRPQQALPFVLRAVTDERGRFVCLQRMGAE
jgi:hypothetical protein